MCLELDPIELISIDEISPNSFKIQWLPNEKNKKLNIKLRYVLEIINQDDKNKPGDRYVISAKQDYYSFTNILNNIFNFANNYSYNIVLWTEIESEFGCFYIVYALTQHNL